jgi:putative two-component system response regulator
MGSRLLSIADAYDAMISDRPFRSALSEVEAVAILQAGSGKQWDPALIQLFVECLIQQNPVIAMQEQFPLRAA